MKKKEVSIYLQLRRFRRWLKSKKKRKQRRITKQKELLRNKAIRHQGSLIHNGSEALAYFMTRHFLHPKIRKQSQWQSQLQ